MARITVKEKEHKKAMMDEIIHQLFIREGWEAVTYDRLAKELDMRKSSIQSYYSKNILFASALQGRIFPVVIQKLDFTSKEAFIETWLKSFHDKECHVFRDTIKMLLQNIIKTGTSPYTKGAVMKLQSLLTQKIGEKEATYAIKWVLGETLFSLREV